MGIDKEEIKYQVDHKLKQARDFQASGKHLHAIQVYNALIEQHPLHTEPYLQLADLYELLGNVSPGIHLLKDFLSREPDNKEVRLYLGQYLLRNSMWEESNDVLSYILPEEEPIVSFFLGYSHFMLEEYELSKINLLNFISAEEESELLQEAYLYLAKIEIELTNFESALSFAKKAEILYGNFWELNLIFAVSYFHLGMYAHALLPIEKAKKLNPNDAPVREWAGKIYLKSGDFLKAEDNFLKYIELTEVASSDIYTNLGEACYQAKKPGDAMVYFEMALKLDPDNKTAEKGKKNASTAIEKNKVNNG